MKYFLLIGLISMPVFAATKPAEKTVKIEQVRSIDYDKGEATVTFWGTNQVYRFEEKAAIMPCLENAHKAKKEVVLQMNQEAKVIENCKLYGGGDPKLSI